MKSFVVALRISMETQIFYARQLVQPKSDVKQFLTVAKLNLALMKNASILAIVEKMPNAS